MNLACTYCHLPVPRSARRNSREPQFCCYGCRIAYDIAGTGGEEGKENWMLVRLGTAVVLSMAVMVFTLPLYMAEAAASETATAQLATDWNSLLRYASLLLTMPVFAILGIPLMNNALQQCQRGNVTTDLLIILGVTAALVASIWTTVTESGHAYFETVCMPLVFVTLGRYLETREKLRASNTLLSLESLLPDDVEVTRDGKTTTIPVNQLEIYDLIHVPAGQSIAVDGVILEGAGFVDERIVTGESEPVAKRKGDHVVAGSTSIDGHLSIQATRIGPKSTLGRLARMLDDAKNNGGRMESLADNLTRWFLPIAVAFALLGAWWGAREGGAVDATRRALAVLLISCPCALGIATPLAAWIALGRAAERGILFRTGLALENLASVKTMAFDKTGTLTGGKPALREFRTDEAVDRNDLLQVAAGLGKQSQHVMARSILQFAKAEQLTPASVGDARTEAGYGVSGQANGRRVSMGSLAMMCRDNRRISEDLEKYAGQSMADGHGLVCLAVDDAVKAVATFSESPRSEARQALRQLETAGIQTIVLSGDHEARAAKLQSELNVETIGGLTPADKLQRIEVLAREGKVAMVGDGLNDAPSLALATVGIAMGCGADISRESADICLLGNNLGDIPWSLKLARRTARTMRRNLAWAFLYNAACIPLAVMGMLTPVLAALAMLLSSLLVVMNSARLAQGEPDD